MKVKISLMRHFVFVVIFTLFSHTNLIANEKLQDLDLLIFANKGCKYNPYKFLKDLNGEDKIIQTDASRSIYVGIDSLANKNFNLTNKYGEKKVNRVKIFSEMFGRDVSEDFEIIIQKSLEEFKFRKLKFDSSSGIRFFCGSTTTDRYHLSALLRVDLNLKRFKLLDGSSAIKNKLANNQLVLLKTIPASEWVNKLNLKC